MSIYYFDSLDNTNDKAKDLVENYNLSYGMVISDLQDKGRGRFGNKWISIKGNFMGTVFFPIKNYNQINFFQNYSLKVLLKTLKKSFKSNIFKIKKPNDLFIDKKKISGILIETFKFKSKLFIIIGIGVNLSKNPIIKNYKTTNLKKIFKKHVDSLSFGRFLLNEMNIL